MRSIERYPRKARRFHTAVYAVTFLLLATGWWLAGGNEGRPSILARLLGVPDAQLHVWLGWILVVLAVAPLLLAWRGVRDFLVETVRRERGDLAWFAALPRAVLTGRFRRHEGHFDPGQRLANVAIVGLLLVLVLTGVALVFVHSGQLFATLDLVHRLATIAFAIVIAGHIVIALGILPGYRGVWRSMHIGGRVPIDVARRLWPGWTERVAGDAETASVDGGTVSAEGAGTVGQADPTAQGGARARAGLGERGTGPS